MLAALLALGASIFLGSSDFVGGLATRRSTVLRATTWTYVGAATLALPALLLPGQRFSQAALWAGVVAGVFALAGYFTFFASMRTAPVGIATAIVGVGEAVVPVVVGVLWYGEVLSWLGWLGVALAMGGALLVGVAEGTGGRTRWQPLVVAVISGIFFGMSVVGLNLAPADAGLISPGVQLLGGLGLLLALVLVVRLRSAAVKGLPTQAPSDQLSQSQTPARAGSVALLSRRGYHLPALAAGVLLAIATMLLMVALQSGQLALVGVIICLYPITAMALARVFLYELLNYKHIVGVAIAIGGCALLALS